MFTLDQILFSVLNKENCLHVSDVSFHFSINFPTQKEKYTAITFQHENLLLGFIFCPRATFQAKQQQRRDSQTTRIDVDRSRLKSWRRKQHWPLLLKKPPLQREKTTCSLTKKTKESSPLCIDSLTPLYALMSEQAEQEHRTRQTKTESPPSLRPSWFISRIEIWHVAHTIRNLSNTILCHYKG